MRSRTRSRCLTICDPGCGCERPAGGVCAPRYRLCQLAVETAPAGRRRARSRPAPTLFPVGTRRLRLAPRPTCMVNVHEPVTRPPEGGGTGTPGVWCFSNQSPPAPRRTMQASPAASATRCSHAPLSAIGYRLSAMLPGGLHPARRGLQPHSTQCRRHPPPVLRAACVPRYRLSAMLTGSVGARQLRAPTGQRPLPWARTTENRLTSISVRLRGRWLRAKTRSPRSLRWKVWTAEALLQQSIGYA